ncbi:MAG: DoxX family protein [Solirubrobacteraceae bacterium]|nr:DoxX family protein [Patulibacter sp.]
MSVHAVSSLARHRAVALEDAFHRLCQRYAVTVLRIALGGVFILFGALKFFPNLSPAQAVAEMTTEKLTLGLVPAQSLLYFVAVVEVTVGVLLLTRRAMRFALWLLAFEMLAILSPLVLLTGELFSGPHHLPSLLGQYILKDFVLLGAVLVLFAMQRGVITVPDPAGDADAVQSSRVSSTPSAPANTAAAAMTSAYGMATPRRDGMPLAPSIVQPRISQRVNSAPVKSTSRRSHRSNRTRVSRALVKSESRIMPSVKRTSSSLAPLNDAKSARHSSNATS